jgi:SsrA-binding protein
MAKSKKAKKGAEPTSPNDATVARNRRATFDYDITQRFEAGIVLTGSEIRSVREGRIELLGSFARFKNRELYLTDMNISPYANAGYSQHVSRSDRKLLLHRRELSRISEALGERGLTVMPIRIYLKKGRAKVELGLGRGRKSYDKRHRIREREEGRQVARALRHSS